MGAFRPAGPHVGQAAAGLSAAWQVLLRTELGGCPGLLEEVPAVAGDALGEPSPGQIIGQGVGSEAR